MKTDVKKFLKQFTFTGIREGDLLLVGEVVRVVSTKDNGRWEIEAANVERDCEECRKLNLPECIHTRTMRIGFGQQGVMKLK